MSPVRSSTSTTRPTRSSARSCSGSTRRASRTSPVGVRKVQGSRGGARGSGDPLRLQSRELHADRTRVHDRRVRSGDGRHRADAGRPDHPQPLDVLDYAEHAIGQGADTTAVAYIETVLAAFERQLDRPNISCPARGVLVASRLSREGGWSEPLGGEVTSLAGAGRRRSRGGPSWVGRRHTKGRENPGPLCMSRSPKPGTQFSAPASVPSNA